MIIRDINALVAQPTRRPHIRERRLITPDDSAEQNVVLIDADAGAAVEVHPVPSSETLYFLSGEYLVLTGTGETAVGPGSCIYFPPGASHGLRCTAGPGQYLVVFAPARRS